MASANFSAGNRPYCREDVTRDLLRVVVLEEVRGCADPLVRRTHVEYVQAIVADAVDKPLHILRLLLGPDVDTGREVVLDRDQQVDVVIGHDVVVERGGVFLLVGVVARVFRRVGFGVGGCLLGSRVGGRFLGRVGLLLDRRVDRLGLRVVVEFDRVVVFRHAWCEPVIPRRPRCGPVRSAWRCARRRPCRS